MCAFMFVEVFMGGMSFGRIFVIFCEVLVVVFVLEMSVFDFVVEPVR